MQRNSKVILGNLGMPGHTAKMIVSVWGNILHLSTDKNQLPSWHFPLPVFKYSIYLPSWQKSEKTNESSWQKCWTDRFRENTDFIGPSVT